MADTVVALVARLAASSGIPADTAENVFHVGSFLDPGTIDPAPLMAAVRDFYIVDQPGQTNFVGNYINESVSRVANACTVLAYASDDLTGATPFGGPIGTLSFGMVGASTGSGLPQEVAATISYNADVAGVPASQANPTPPPATIRPQQRRRGRTYIGPLQNVAGAEVASQFLPTATFMTDLTVAFKAMAEAINDPPDTYFGIWSKADAEVWQAIEGYVDNAWDTQRRRGIEASSRTLFTIAP